MQSVAATAVTSATATSLKTIRDALAADVMGGRLAAASFPERYVAAADAWLKGLFEEATGERSHGYSLIAVGGYGRRELCPGSDLDLVLVHRHRRRYKEVADHIWYAIWDTGLRLDHSVRTPSEVLQMARSDLRVVLGLLDARVIAGDTAIGASLRDRVIEIWRRDAPRAIPELRDQLIERHRSAGQLAFLLEPDLKQSGGGLRDLAALQAVAVAFPALQPLAATATIAHAGRLITSARVVVHARSGTNSDRLALQEQDEVADVLGFVDADALMAALASAGRTIAALGDEVWRRAGTALAAAEPDTRTETSLGRGVVLRRGEIGLAADAAPADDPGLLVRVALAAAQRQALIEQDALERLAASAAAPPTPWDSALREDFVALLSTGDALVPVVDTLDQRHLFELLLPEWTAVRNRPQRNAYHRFTVDRHLLEAVARAGESLGTVSRPDLLVLAALLHDIGKGQGGNHSEIGTVIAENVMERMGYPTADVETVVDLVAYHLVLPEFATRRDLDDPSTAVVVAKLVKDRERLGLLAALTEADGQATGTSAWGPWKAELVQRLVERVADVLDGRPLPEAGPPTLTPEQESLVAAGTLAVHATGRHVTVVAPDRPGLLAAVTGALALNSCNVRRANAWDGPNDMAIEIFDVEQAFERPLDWAKIERDIEAALNGTLSLEQRLAEQNRVYASARRVLAAHPAQVRVTIDNTTSERASILEVRTPDRIGILHRITAAVAAADLDVSSALVDTLGHEVIDTFYVRDRAGRKIDDPERVRALRAELEEVVRGGG